MQITAIILAGGKSLRMGTDKALLEMDGITLLEKAIRLCEIFTSNIIISSNQPEHKKYGYRVIADEIENCGPMGGIYSCLKQSDTDWNFVISVDSPFVEPGFIRFLISETGNFDAVVPVHKKGKEPLIAFYHQKSIKIMHEKLLEGDYKMNNFLNNSIVKTVNSQVWKNKFPNLFRNLNRPEDYSVKYK